MTCGAASEAPPRSRAGAFVAVVLGVAAAGIVTGALWAGLAPCVGGAIVLTRSGERVQTYLGDEAEHFFVAPLLLLGMLTVLAVLAAATCWQWVARRGPGMVGALWFGMAAAAALAALDGRWLVHRRYGVADLDTAPVTPEQRVYYFTDPPPSFFGHTPLQIAATVLLPAGAAALVYGLCATWTTRDDLGGCPAATPGVDALPRR